jgi:hypothetical protein
MNDCEHEWIIQNDHILRCSKCTSTWILRSPGEYIEVKFIIEPPKPKAVLLWKELKMWVTNDHTNHPRSPLGSERDGGTY